MAKTSQNREKLLRISLYIMIASLVVIGIGAFIALGAFTREPYIVSERTIYRIDRVSDLNLTFLLEPNEIYETEILHPRSDETIPIYLSLVRILVVNYTYTLSQGSASGNIKISVLLLHPDGWVKKYYEIPISIGSSSASTAFQLNLSNITDLMARLSKQVMANQDMYTIRIAVSGDIDVSYQQYSKRDLLSHSIDLNVLVSRNKIELSGNQSLQNTFEERSKSIEVAKLMGMSVDTARSVSLAVTSGGLAIMLFSIILRSTMKKPEKPEEILEKRYSQVIVEVSAQMTHGNKYKYAIYIDKPEELIKLSRILEKPVLKECYEVGRCEYYIADQDTAYILRTSDQGLRTPSTGVEQQDEKTR